MSRPNLVIGGSSHVGKSTLGAALGETLGWEVLSTDAMTRHPGRPWPEVRPHVAEFYGALSHDSILTFLRHHHGNMWPHIRKLLCDRFAAGTPCILEGSALRPEFLATLPAHQNACVCLVAPADFIVRRIHANSGYAQSSPDACRLIDIFVERSLRENDAMLKAAMEHEIDYIDASDPDAVAQLRDRLIAAAIGTPR